MRFLAFCANCFPSFMQFLAEWPRFMHRKQREECFNFSMRSVTDVTFLESWAQWPRPSQNAQNSSGCLFVAALFDFLDFVSTLNAAVVGRESSVLSKSPRIFCVVSAPSTSSFRCSISLVMSPSEMFSLLAWRSQRRHMSSGNARRILGASIRP